MNTSSTTTGTVRTGWNATALTVLGYISTRIFGFELDLSDPVVIAVVAGAVPIFYRLSRELSDRFPVIGRVLFGTTATPEYDAV